MTPGWPRRAAVIGAGALGSALAQALERTGCEVVRCSRHAPDRFMDVTDPESVAAAAAGLPELDLVLVATGLLHKPGVAPEKNYRMLEAEGLAQYFAVNATGPALVARYFLPLLPRAGRGMFAALSARVGSIGDNRAGGWHGYRASKAALNMILRGLALELARTRPDQIVLGLHPGTVASGLSAPFSHGAALLFRPEESAGHLLEVMRRAVPAQSGRVLAWDGSIVPE